MIVRIQSQNCLTVPCSVAVDMKAAKCWNKDEMSLRLPRVSSIGDEVMSCACNICLLLVCGLQGPRASTQGLLYVYRTQQRNRGGIPRPLFRSGHRFTGTLRKFAFNLNRIWFYSGLLLIFHFRCIFMFVCFRCTFYAGRIISFAMNESSKIKMYSPIIYIWIQKIDTYFMDNFFKIFNLLFGMLFLGVSFCWYITLIGWYIN